MYPHELIGKKAIRKAPTCYGDHSYTTEPLIILTVTESHIVTKYPECHWLFDKSEDKKHILDYRWIDDNWTDYDGLMALADENMLK